MYDNYNPNYVLNWCEVASSGLDCIPSSGPVINGGCCGGVYQRRHLKSTAADAIAIASAIHKPNFLHSAAFTAAASSDSAEIPTGPAAGPRLSVCLSGPHSSLS